MRRAVPAGGPGAGVLRAALVVAFVLALLTPGPSSAGALAWLLLGSLAAGLGRPAPVVQPARWPRDRSSGGR